MRTWYPLLSFNLKLLWRTEAISAVVIVLLAPELVLGAVVALFLEAEADLTFLPLFKERPTRRHVDMTATGLPRGQLEAVVESTHPSGILESGGELLWNANIDSMECVFTCCILQRVNHQGIIRQKITF